MLATEVNTDDGRAMKLFIVLVGVKGDWVYLRIWFAKWGLALGYVCVCACVQKAVHMRVGCVHAAIEAKLMLC